MIRVVEWTKRAQKALSGLPKHDAVRIQEAMDRYAVEGVGDVVALQGKPGWRLCVGKYRAVFIIEFNQLVILVLDVGHRREIYW